MIRSSFNCFITTIELIGISFMTTQRKLSLALLTLNNWIAQLRISHTRVSITLMKTWSTLSIDKVNASTWTVTTPWMLNLKKWLIKILVRCIWSTTKPWWPDLPVKLFSSRSLRRKMKTTQARLWHFGSNTTSLTSEVSFTSSKETKESKWLLMTRFTSI